MDQKKLTDTLGKDVPYDLRQVFAVELVGEHLKDIARARKADNYSAYFKCLKDLWIIIRHKIKTSNVKQATTDYNTKMNAAVEKANKYPNEFIGQTKDPTGCAAIETALNDVEMFLYKQIEDANMFGSSKKIPGL